MNRLGSGLSRTTFYLLSIVALISIAMFKIDLTDTASVIADFGHFFIIGIFAATVANSTGAGGGIIFLPAFTLLGLTVEQALATSFAIQSFGMTSGALTWLALARREYHTINQSWRALNPILLIAVPPSLAGLILVQQMMPEPPFNIHVFFSTFSIIVGGIILIRALRRSTADDFSSPPLTISTSVVVAISCFIGGGITAWLSIGVGEILAIVLLMRGYNVRFSVATAVCISSITVLVALPYYLVGTDSIHFYVLMFAAPAAMIGGFAARYLAVAISAIRLKVFLSLWVIISGVVYLGVN